VDNFVTKSLFYIVGLKQMKLFFYQEMIFITINKIDYDI